MRLAFLIALLVPATAHAEPAVDLSRCDLFDPATATRAIRAEVAHPDGLSVTIDCPDPLTARVSVGALTRQLDLGEVSAAQRLRLLALTVAELADDAASAAAAAAAAAPAAAPVAATVAAAETAAPPLAPSAAPESPSRRAALRGTADFRVGARVFLSEPTPLVDLSLGATRGRLAADLFLASRRATDPLGTVRGTLAGAGLAVTLACRDPVCISARGGAGLATLTADPAGEAVTADDRAALYLETGPRLEARILRARWSASLLVDAGWSWGLVGLAADREVVHLSGPVVTTSLGIGWRR